MTCCANGTHILEESQLSLVTRLYGHDGHPVWTVRWRTGAVPSSQLASAGGSRILLWECSSGPASQISSTPTQPPTTGSPGSAYSAEDGVEPAWRLKSTIYNEKESNVEDWEQGETLSTPRRVRNGCGQDISCGTVASSSTVPIVWARRIPKMNAKVHERTVRNVAWTHDGQMLAAASFDATTSVWSEKNPGIQDGWESVTKLEGHEYEVKRCCWSPDGQSLATCSRDKTVWVFTKVPVLSEVDALEEGTISPDASSGSSRIDFACEAILNGHSQDVKCVTWHPYEPLIVSASYDNTLKVWAPQPSPASHLNAHGPTGPDSHSVDAEWQLVTTLEGHTSTVWDASFSPSGLEMASCSDDKTVRIWRAQLPFSPETSDRPSLNPRGAGGPTAQPSEIKDPASSLTSLKDLNCKNLDASLQTRSAALPWYFVYPGFKPLRLGSPRELTGTSTPEAPSDGTASVEKAQPSATVLKPQNPDCESSASYQHDKTLVSKAQWTSAAVIQGHHTRAIYAIAWHPVLDVVATACGDNALRLFRRRKTGATRDFAHNWMPPSADSHGSDWYLELEHTEAHAKDVNSVSWKTVPERKRQELGCKRKMAEGL